MLNSLTFCFTGGRAIFLDQLKDRYFCLTESRSLALRTALDSAGDPYLLDWETIIPGKAFAGRSGTVPLQCACSRADGDAINLKAKPRLRVALALAVLFLKVSFELRHRGFARALDLIASKKMTMVRRRDPAHALSSISASLAALRRFHSLNERCLIVALATSRLMIRRGLSPTLIIGVKVGPFAAHAWVQHESTVVTCRVDEARLYEPILTI